MSKSALLDKLKGRTRTFVVHSNTNPYAAAAAMGAAMGRSQQLGPYFNLSRQLRPGVQAQATATSAQLPAGDGMSVDFIADWSDFLNQSGLPIAASVMTRRGPCKRTRCGFVRVSSEGAGYRAKSGA